MRTINPGHSAAGSMLSRWRAHALAIAVLTLGGTAIFGVLHALLIEPIWPRLAGGLPRAMLTSVGMTWCYSELLSRGRLRRGIAGGLLFGGAIWLALLPVSLVAAILRAAGVRSQLGWLEPPLDLFVVAATGAVAGFALTRSARGTASAAACMAGVLGVLNAPLAIELDALQRMLLLGLLPIYAAAGMVLSMLFGHSSSADPADKVYQCLRSRTF
jgi:hypothetical protein